jgi:hypothetical protein
VHRRTDRLGHRLRGESVPDLGAQPEHAYRWVRHSPLAMAATVTLVIGGTVAEALRAFGADPSAPEPAPLEEPWVGVLDAGDAVILVEANGYRGAQADVLAAASASGRAASWFWNVNALSRLSFAEGGRLLAAFEPRGGEDLPAELSSAVSGLDFADSHQWMERGLVAVERFTGRGVTAGDVACILDAGVGYPLA